MSIKSSTFDKLKFFSQTDHKYFIAWISAQLKTDLAPPGTILYEAGDDINKGFYCMSSGIALFIKQELAKQIIGVVDPENILKMD